MQFDLDRYDDVVHAIYGASLHPERWPEVMRGVAELFEAPRGVLFTYADSPRGKGFTFAHNIPSAAMEYWSAKGMHEDPFVQAALARGLSDEGTAMLGADLVPMDVLLRTRFYQELWQPLGIARLCSGVVFNATDTHKLPTAISLLRHLEDPPFEPAHEELMRRLLAHFARSLGVMFHLRDHQLQVAASQAALELLGNGVVLLDAQCRMQFCNGVARDIFRQASTVCLGQALFDGRAPLRLHARLAPFERRFQSMLRQAVQPLPQDVEQHFSEALVLPTEQGQPACAVHAAPLGDGARLAATGSAARAIVFLYDLRSAARVRPRVLSELFGMTTAEAQAALQLTQGGSAEQMAARLAISANTFKSQLQAAYLKSGTHKQGDMLKLLLALQAH